MSEEPDRERRPGTETISPRAERIFAGILLILAGACILLVGGGCTIFWIVVLFGSSNWGGAGGPGLMLLSLAVAGLGLFAIVKGVQMLRGPRRRGGGSA
jgi:hypothetical protein